MNRNRRSTATKPAPCIPAAADPIWRRGHGAVALRVAIEALGGMTHLEGDDLWCHFPAEVADQCNALINEYEHNRSHQDDVRPDHRPTLELDAAVRDVAHS